MDQSELINLIITKLKSQSEEYKRQFEKNRKSFGIGYCAIDDLLPLEHAKDIYSAFDPANQAWREMKSFREKKLTSKKFDSFSTILKDITFAFQSDDVLKQIELITGMKNQLPDPKLYAGGLSIMRTGDFLDPHIDNSHDHFQKHYRRLNLLYYVAPDWCLDDGGNLELWNEDVTEKVTIVSQYNRLVLMETHNLSWHSVSKVKKTNAVRCCVSNYYFSAEAPKPEIAPYSHVTSFLAPPDQKIKRLVCKIDNNLRSFVRLIKKTGFGKKDLYEYNSNN